MVLSCDRASTDRERFESMVVALIDVLPLAERVEALGIPVRAMGMRPGVPDPRGVVRLARLLHRERPQVVQTWMDHSNLIGGVAARLAARAPVIWGVHHANHIPRLTKGTTLMTVSACPGCPGGSPPGSFAAPNRSGRRTRGGASRRSG